MNIMMLSMTETSNSDYQVIGLDVDTQTIISLTGITRDNVMSNGKPVWDIGATTYAENVIKTGMANSYAIDGKVEMIKPFDRNDFLKTLKLLGHSKSNFFVNTKTTYSIIRIQSLLDIYEKNNKYYAKVLLYANTNNVYQKADESCVHTADGNYTIEDLLIKDLRWINYWKWTKKQNVYEEKRVIYRKQFNKHYHDKFLLLYRHRFNNGTTNHWVAGLYLL